MTEYAYPLDNKWTAARERLAMLESVWDHWTFRNLLRIGVGEGWTCLEVAGGGGSITEWLCRRVGPSGHVTATDLEPHFLEALGASNLEVLRHDIIRDILPVAKFDCVHARAVLTFLPEPNKAITKMAAAVKPGGWLLLEEPDYISTIPDPTMKLEAASLSTKAWRAMLTQLTSDGYNIEFGRHLHHDVEQVGLVDIQTEGFVNMQLGGTPSARFWKLTFEQLQDRIVQAGRLTPVECAAYIRLLECQDYRWVNLMFMSTWGRQRELIGGSSR
jgi:ubiquinone/menaquinone biosynthesis C-methylase UbiE